MNRGEVHRIQLSLPDRILKRGTRARPKYVVLLQGDARHFSNESDVAVVVASTRKRQTPPRSFEVLVGTAQGFDHDTIIDCRWVYTVQKSEVAAGDHLATLSEDVMESIALALVAGLQLA